MNNSDSEEYRKKKHFFSRVLTIYGRKPVLEALMNDAITPYRLHLSDSNKPASILSEITELAQQKGAEILHHSKEALSRISKNKKQDQGVAIDLHMQNFKNIEEFIANPPERFEIIALDRVTNPQNVGMIIRSIAASPATALLLPNQGCAKLDALVIKASAGALFKANILRCDTLEDGLKQLSALDSKIVGLALSATQKLSDIQHHRCVFVLGNESEGISEATEKSCTDSVKIPMNNNVESLNVAVTASLIAFRNAL